MPSLRVFGQVARSGPLRRVVLAYGLFIVCEYAVWIAVLVFAYGFGGPTAAGLVALAQLVPSVVVAPLAAGLADRHPPAAVLAGGYAVQALGTAGVAAAVFADTSEYVAYACAVVASTAVSVARPAQSALVPSLSREVAELTAGNVVLGWAESVGIVIAGAGVALVLTLVGVAWVFAGSVVLLLAAGLLVLPLRALAPGHGRAVAEGSGQLREAGREVWRSRPSRLLVGLLGAEYVVIGALDVLFVVLALDILAVGDAWVGYLNMAYGVGGVLLGAVAALVIGRRLGPVILVAALVIGLGLAGTSLATGPWSAAVLLAVVGGSRTLFDVATRALLQRAVSADMVARIFGLAEGLSMAGLAVGSVLAPLLVDVAGERWALVGAAAVLPGVVLVQVGLLRRIDQHAQVPIVEISLLRSLPLFRSLPAQSLEGLARALEPVAFAAGETIVRQGEEGDRYFAVVDGSVEISQRGREIAVLGRGDGLGEIALLDGGRRTATAVARTDVRAYALGRVPFLTAVNGHVPTQRSAVRITEEVRERDARRSAADAAHQRPRSRQD